MAAENTFNPYAAPGADFATQTGWDSQGLDYSRSVKFIVESPNWTANLLFTVLCNVVGGFIPILPGLVLIGYQCEMLEGLTVRPNEPYPDFKTDRLMEYLVRGVWPFVVGLLAAIVMVPLILVAIAMPVTATIVLANAAGKDGAEVVAFVMVPLIVLVAMVGAVICNVALVPFLLRAALTQDIGASLDFQFAKDFVRRMWKETIYCGLFLIALAIVAQVVGLLLVCIGVLFTVPIVQFAQVHLGMQLYKIYIARGGQKIPLTA
jgi:hypothetical protein